jgi:hypothetical protein
MTNAATQTVGIPARLAFVVGGKPGEYTIKGAPGTHGDAGWSVFDVRADDVAGIHVSQRRRRDAMLEAFRGRKGGALMNRPDTFDCDCGDLCTSCGCSECGRKLDPDTRGPLTLPSGRVVQACAECRAAEAEDTDGVPVEVPEEESGAQTVRAAYIPIGRAGLGEVRAERKAASL